MRVDFVNDVVGTPTATSGDVAQTAQDISSPSNPHGTVADRRRRASVPQTQGHATGVTTETRGHRRAAGDGLSCPGTISKLSTTNESLGLASPVRFPRDAIYVTRTDSTRESFELCQQV